LSFGANVRQDTFGLTVGLFRRQSQRRSLEPFCPFLNRLGLPSVDGCDSTTVLGGRPAAMARAYSLDLRERVVAAVADGQPCRAVVSPFRVSVASVVK
jgi:hypothetical protein